MAGLGEVLGWKFNHFPGISTLDGVLTKWPTQLGPRPTKQQVDDWTAEYLERPQFKWTTATAEEKLEEIRKRLDILG